MSGDLDVGGNGQRARSGTRTLELLTKPLNCLALKALEDGPRGQADLRREAGKPAQTTLRVQLNQLHSVGAIEKRRRNRFRGVLEYELSGAGHGLLEVTTALERWLEHSPEGPLEIGSPSAKAAVKALVEGWSTTMVRFLAAKRLTLTELDSLFSSINYPSLERRLSAMRLAGLVEPHAGNGRGTPYGVTDWARHSVVPLTAASRWERNHAPAEAPPADRRDIETAFLLAAPLMRPAVDTEGSCRFAVDVSNGNGDGLAGIVVAVRDGRLLSCTTRLGDQVDAWATGTLGAWFAAIMEHDIDGLERGGDSALARALVDDLRSALFARPVAG